MVKRSTKKVFSGIWLLLSVAGGVLFSFGSLKVIEEIGWSPWVAVGLGAAITLGTIYSGRFTTETAFALKKK